jgi:DNA polymerase-3 subunit delta'
VVLILTSRNADDLLPTIVSRCEVLQLRPVPKGRVEKGLISVGLDEAEAHKLASLSAGRPGFALRLSQSPEELELRSQRIHELMELVAATRSERFDYVERFRSGSGETLKDVRDEAANLLELWLAIWRDVFLIQLDRADRVQNDDVLDVLKNLAETLDREQTVKLLGEVEATLESIEDYANIRLALENLMLTMPRTKVVL